MTAKPALRRVGGPQRHHVPVSVRSLGDQLRGLGLALAAAEHPHREDRRGEHPARGEADLHAEQPLRAPVDVLEVEQQRRLVEGQPGAGAEAEGEHLLEALVLGDERRAAGREREQDSGHEVVDVGVAEDDVVGRPPTAAGSPGAEPDQREGAEEAGEDVEEDGLAPGRLVVGGPATPTVSSAAIPAASPIVSGVGTCWLSRAGAARRADLTGNHGSRPPPPPRPRSRP